MEAIDLTKTCAIQLSNMQSKLRKWEKIPSENNQTITDKTTCHLFIIWRFWQYHESTSKCFRQEWSNREEFILHNDFGGEKKTYLFRGGVIFEEMICCKLLNKCYDIMIKRKWLERVIYTTILHYCAILDKGHPGLMRWNEWCLRPRFCTVRLYWSGDNLGCDEYWYESCPACRGNHSTCWPAVR